MATMNYSVKVEGDPSLLADANMGFHGDGFGMGMNMGVGAPGGVGFSASGDGSANINMNLGMPNVNMHVADSNAHVHLGGVSVSTNVTPQASISFNAPAPNISLSVPGIGFQVSAPPVAVAGPPLVFGNDWSVTVQNPHKIGVAGEDQHTVFDFVLRTNLQEYGASQFHVRSRRYSEVRRFWQMLCSQFGGHIFSAFPEKNFFGRFDAGVVGARTRAFQTMFDNIGRDAQIRKSQLVKDFFFGTTTFGGLGS